LGKQDMILSFTWLQEHNPEINWSKGEVWMRHIPFADIELLNSPSLVFPYREALYKDVWGMGSETQQKGECESKFISALDSEFLDKAIEVSDRIYAATLCPLLMAAEI
ncbi:hypothetical protein C0995_015402, partial [Termitomyces sp. Mi166